MAYADFVTAMMAFFMLMWLLNATTEKQQKGLADYFSPTIPINRISGGGDGAFGGENVLSQNVKIQSGTGATNQQSSPQQSMEAEQASGSGMTSGQLQDRAAEIEKMLIALGGESMTMERALRHIVTKITDEGLVIELFDLENAPLFTADTATPEQVTTDIAGMLAEVLALTENKLAINGHVRSFPITLIANPVWDLSSARAQAMRTLLEGAGMTPGRIERVSGFADRRPVTANPVADRNNRLEVILLRRDR